MIQPLLQSCKVRCQTTRSKLILLGLFVIFLRTVSNILYFKTYGLRASFGADIWYFAGVARGYHHLFFADPLQWLLPCLGNLPPERLYDVLLLFSNALHLLSVFLLFGCVRDLYNDEWAAFWSSAIYSSFVTSFHFCTASFHHQQFGLPILIGLLWLGYRLLNGKKIFSYFWALFIFLAMIGLGIGPDVLVILILSIPCGILRYLQKIKSPSKRWIAQTLVLGLVIYGFISLSPLIKELLTSLAAHFRGIDLAAQYQLQAADLMPFGWSMDSTGFTPLRIFWIGLIANYHLAALVFFGMIIWAWMKSRFFEVMFAAVAIGFSTQAGRFFYVVEIGFAILLGWVLAHGLRSSIFWKNIIGSICLFLFLGLAAWRGIACFYPGNMVIILSHLQKNPKPHSFVLCTPTYGFLIQGLTEVKPTSDLHHVDPTWVRLALRPTEEALEALKKHGVTHLFFTSYDFRLGWTSTPDGNKVFGIASSGGFEYFLPSIMEDIQKTLVYQALTENSFLPGAKLLAASTDKATQIRSVLFELK